MQQGWRNVSPVISHDLFVDSHFLFTRFRWVQCQLEALEQCTTGMELRETLDNLPDDLSVTYERILFKIDTTQREGKIARRALDWLVVALQPMRLSQILEGLSIDLTQQALNRNFGPLHEPVLLDALSSLVIYDELTDVVILSHFTVKVCLIW